MRRLSAIFVKSVERDSTLGKACGSMRSPCTQIRNSSFAHPVLQHLQRTTNYSDITEQFTEQVPQRMFRHPDAMLEVLKKEEQD
mmetsp:Transcript_9478/g.40982  ORF Transcript_9478/g.40982 Transcript_9478/m.40982 type:complete len:84 (+) Transcript_9478:1137-1388(+)